MLLLFLVLLVIVTIKITRTKPDHFFKTQFWLQWHNSRSYRKLVEVLLKEEKYIEFHGLEIIPFD